MRLQPLACAITASCSLLTSTALHADEGMWLLNAPPLRQLKERYGFEPTPAWLEHVQKSSVRFNNGGSGSFVSADGLIITNHHVASDAIDKLSSEKKNLLRDGFHAKTREEELRCVDLELNVLVSIEDVTAQVNAAVQPSMDAPAAFAARRAAKEKIERESLSRTGLRSDVVTLYQGAEYHLYCYKRYTDVRLVFAPEQQAAFFGGDPDNFEFPRFNLDVSFLRAYEDGKPAKVEHFFKVQPQGVAENELVFVAGHPGRTNRLLTLPELEFQRDVRVPKSAEAVKVTEVALASWAARNAENARRAQHGLFGTQNSRKVLDGRLLALLDPAVLAKKRNDEVGLQTFARQQPVMEDALSAWPRISEAQKVIAANYTRHGVLEGGPFNSTLFHIARQLLRAVDERAKPSGERLREYRDSNRVSLELDLFSEEPIYDDYEQLKLTHSLIQFAEKLGVNDPLAQIALGGQSPAARSTALVTGTRMKDVAFRKKLYAMTSAELAQVDDPMLALARAIDPAARAVRKIVEEQDEVKEQAHAKIAKVRYAKDGSSVYPDATFTLRLAYGAVKGYEENGHAVAPFTTLGGKFARSDAQGGRTPFELPTRWKNAKPNLALDTPYDFVSTADIIGGNSGSPTLNRAGEFVGIIFDGNIQSLGSDFAYSDVQSRAVSVDIRAILESLKTIYSADALLKELVPGTGAVN
ncbi:S46 family peptidase [Verrucomicrobiota bacterium sgz303538]